MNDINLAFTMMDKKENKTQVEDIFLERKWDSEMKDYFRIIKKVLKFNISLGHQDIPRSLNYQSKP